MNLTIKIITVQYPYPGQSSGTQNSEMKPLFAHNQVIIVLSP